MNDIAIKVENLSKRYRISLKEEMPETVVTAMDRPGGVDEAGAEKAV